MDGAEKNTVGLQSPERVGEYLLGDPLQISFQFIEPPGTGEKIPQDQHPLAADKGHSGGHRAGGHLLTGQHGHFLLRAILV